MTCEQLLIGLLSVWAGWFIGDNALFWLNELKPHWLPKWLRS